MSIRSKEVQSDRIFELLEACICLIGAIFLLTAIHLIPGIEQYSMSGRRNLIVVYFSIAGFWAGYAAWSRFDLFGRWIDLAARGLDPRLRMQLIRGGSGLNRYVTSWAIAVLFLLVVASVYLCVVWDNPRGMSYASQGTLAGPVPLPLQIHVTAARFWGWLTFLFVVIVLLFPLAFRHWRSSFQHIQAFYRNLHLLRVAERTDVTLYRLIQQVIFVPSSTLRITTRGHTCSFQVASVGWHWEELCRNVLVFGQTGTGKTSCVMIPMLAGILESNAAARSKLSGLVLDPKGDYWTTLSSICATHGLRAPIRLDFSDPRTSAKWNPLAEKGKPVHEIVADVILVARSLTGGQNSQDSFFTSQAQQWMENAIDLLLVLDAGPPSFRSLYELSSSTTLLNSRLHELAAVDSTLQTDGQKLAKLQQYWAGILDTGESAPEQLAGTLGYVQNLTSPFIHPPASDLFCGHSDFTLDDLLNGGDILYAYVPIDQHASLSRSVLTLLKLMYFRAVRSSGNNPGRNSFFFCDEYQQLATFFRDGSDSEFFASCRSYNHSSVVATQNLSGLRAQSSSEGSGFVDQLLGNCATKIFLKNDDESTNAYAQDQFGALPLVTVHQSTSGGTRRGSPSTDGFSESTDNVQLVPKDSFSNLLTPSRGFQTPFAESYIVHPRFRFVHTYRWAWHSLSGYQGQYSSPTTRNETSSTAVPDPMENFR